MSPRWMNARDRPWLRDLVELYRSLVGAPRGELDLRLVEEATRARAPGFRLACSVLDGLFSTEMVAAVEPRRARAAAFGAAAGRIPREEALARAGRALGVAAGEIERALFADLPSRRIVRAPREELTLDDLELRCNLAIVGAALSSSSSVTLHLEGNARSVVRHSLLRGLMCTVSRAAGGRVRLAISGPLALFRRTRLYGRQLAELVPLLPWSRDFLLEARCVVRGESGRLVLDPSAPIPASREPRLYDSRLERRFARDFTRLSADWELVREPEPCDALGTLVFPDFAIVHRRDRGRRWLLEIAGFWTAEYIESKLRRLAAAGIERLILCLDADRDCGNRELPATARVLRFVKRVDAQAVLAVLEGRPRPPST